MQSKNKTGRLLPPDHSQLYFFRFQSAPVTSQKEGQSHNQQTEHTEPVQCNAVQEHKQGLHSEPQTGNTEAVENATAEDTEPVQHINHPPQKSLSESPQEHY